MTDQKPVIDWRAEKFAKDHASVFAKDESFLVALTIALRGAEAGGRSDGVHDAEFSCQVVLDHDGTEQIIERASDELARHGERKVDEIIRDEVVVQIKAAVAEQVGALLADGIQPTTSWGVAQGPKVSVLQAIHKTAEDALSITVKRDTGKPASRHDYGTISMLQYLVKEGIHEGFLEYLKSTKETK